MKLALASFTVNLKAERTEGKMEPEGSEVWNTGKSQPYSLCLVWAVGLKNEIFKAFQVVQSWCPASAPCDMTSRHIRCRCFFLFVCLFAFFLFSARLSAPPFFRFLTILQIKEQPKAIQFCKRDIVSNTFHSCTAAAGATNRNLSSPAEVHSKNKNNDE